MKDMVDNHQEIFGQLTKAKRILVALPQVLSPDSVASGLALKLFLKKMDKDVEVISSGLLSKELQFLPDAVSIRKELVASKALVAVLNTSKQELGEISYQVSPGKVSIFLKPKVGLFSPQDITFENEKFPYDLVIVLDCRSLEDLGPVFEQSADVFFETPIVNIDNHPGNKNFGSINLVDLTATAISEMLASLLEKYESRLLDEDIATCLLTGIINKTNSFQHARTTPNAFLKASGLINLGARQQEVIKFLFKSKPLSLLKLWGRALARLKTKDELSLAYCLLTLSDFEKSESSAVDLPGVLKEIVANVSGYQAVAILAELPQSRVRLLFYGHALVNSNQLQETLGKQATNLGGNVLQIDFENSNILEIEKQLLATFGGISKPANS